MQYIPIMCYTRSRSRYVFLLKSGIKHEAYTILQLQLFIKNIQLFIETNDK